MDIDIREGWTAGIHPDDTQVMLRMWGCRADAMDRFQSMRCVVAQHQSHLSFGNLTPPVAAAVDPPVDESGR
jgi:hypothetical protein